MDEPTLTYAVPDTDGYLAISDGTLLRPIGGAVYPEEMAIVPSRRIRGYHYCHVKLAGKYRTVRKHRLLCRAFHGEPTQPGLVARHLDDNKDNNRFENLAWGTVKDNTDDAIANGVFPTGIQRKGSAHFKAKLTEDLVFEIRWLLSEGAKCIDIARLYVVSDGTICNIKNRKNWTHI